MKTGWSVALIILSFIVGLLIGFFIIGSYYDHVRIITFEKQNVFYAITDNGSNSVAGNQRICNFVASFEDETGSCSIVGDEPTNNIRISCRDLRRPSELPFYVTLP